MPKPTFSDMMRVTVPDPDGHMVRVLDLEIRHDVVLQGGAWKPGVVLRGDRDMEADVICALVNESGFPTDADGVPIGARGEDEGTGVAWTAERVPEGTPRPTIEEWLSGSPRP